MHTHILLTTASTLLFVSAKAQDTMADRYNRIFDTLHSYIKSPATGLFKNAVFYSEAAYFNDFTYKQEFEDQITLLTTLAQGWSNVNHFSEYRFSDSLNLHKNFAVYKILKDTVKIIAGNGQEFHTAPFEYDYDDFFGSRDWSKMFVTKLLATHKGNCHSLPYLYKILADELGATCWLGLAPNHLYIKNRCKKTGWYNTELTSGTFPIDAWITASGYIPLQAIQNGIYMDTVSNQQAIALCVLDLAKGYEFQTKNYYDGFILKCCELVLQYHPVNVQALLLKAETLKRIYEKQQKDNAPLSSTTYREMEGLYTKLFDLGYREMPEQMYQDWLNSLIKQKSKYVNNQVERSMQRKN